MFVRRLGFSGGCNEVTRFNAGLSLARLECDAPIFDIFERVQLGAVGAEPEVLDGMRGASGVPGAASHLPIATAHKVIAQAPRPVLTVRHTQSWATARFERRD